MTWHYIDSKWNLCSVPIATLNMGTAAKSGSQLRAIMEEILCKNLIVGSDEIRVHTATSDNEASTASAVDLLTNYVGSIRCVVHTLALVVNDVFEVGTVWHKYLEHVNKITSYFNFYQKAAQALARKQLEEGISADRLQRLKHDISTRWHSRMAAMSAYLSRIDTIAALRQELDISNDDLPSLSTEQRDVLAEFITVLGEVRRVARQLEADKKVTMSRAPRLLLELHETLQIMAGSMSLSSGESPNDSFMSVEDAGFGLHATAPRASTAKADLERDEARSVRLEKAHSKALSIKIADRLQQRLGDFWKKVSTAAALWEPLEGVEAEPSRDIQRHRRVVLFHVAAVLDVNECCLDFLGGQEQDRTEYMQVLYKVVVREAIELDSSLLGSASELEVVFRLFHKEMRRVLKEYGRREPGVAPSYWRDVNQTRGLVSPVPFNTIARAALSSQASSAPAESLFSDLGRREGNQSQSLLTGTLEMTETIRVFVCNELKNITMRQARNSTPYC